MDAKTDFELKPYVGAGDIAFGMTPNDVEFSIGKPDDISVNHLNQRVEFRSFMNLGYSTDEEQNLIHIGFGRQMEGVRFKDIFIFIESDKVVLQKLIDEDPQPFLYLGFVVFLKLGIALTGFHDNDISQKAVTQFVRGAWDKRIPKLMPFKIEGIIGGMDTDKGQKLADKQTKIAPTVELGTTIQTGTVCPQSGIWQATVGEEKLFLPEGGNVPYVRLKLPQTLAQKMAGKFSYGNAEETTWVLREYRDKSGKPLA